jgi:hypothetical protein
MINEKDLNKCIDNLAEINGLIGGDSNIRRLLLEVGYILKQELEVVSSWNTQFNNTNKLRGYGNVDVKKLIEDNTQLFNENRQLLDANLKLKAIIDSKIPYIEEKTNIITNGINHLSKSLTVV